MHESGYCTATVHIVTAIRALAAAGAISLARRLSFSRASRFIGNFIWEYFLKTCLPGLEGKRTGYVEGMHIPPDLRYRDIARTRKKISDSHSY